MSTNNGCHLPLAVLSIPKLDKLIIPFAWGIHAALTGNTNFPNLTAMLDAFADDIEAYEDAETQARTRGQGLARQRNAKRRKVTDGLKHLRDQVQGAAEMAQGSDAAAAIIVSAGMRIRKIGKRIRSELTARNAGISGTVVVEARAVNAVATYYFQYSVDQVSWISLPDIMKATVEISGLTPVQTYYFRFRALTRTREIGFSQVVSLLVV